MASETNDTLVAKKARNLDVLHRAFSLMIHDKTLDPSLLRRPRLVFLILPVSTRKPKRESP